VKRFLNILVVMVALMGIMALNVQAQVVKGISGKGIKVGLNMANVTGDDADIAGMDKKSLLGFAVGGFLTYNLMEIVAIQPEVLYTMKGAKYEDAGGTENFKLAYIEIPVLAKLMLATQSNIKPNFFAGPALGILLSAKAGDTDVKDQTKSTDFGFILGAGLNFNMASGGAITLDARYNMGLTNINDSSDDAKSKNSVLSFLVGYGF